MNILRKNIGTIKRVCFALIVVFSILLASCNPTKYVPQGETLLNRNTINLNKEGIKKENIAVYIKQPANKRIFGARFYLWLYNLSNINKEKWPHSWLRKIGEPPVIFNQAQANQSRNQIRSYVLSKGYFDGKVADSTATKDRQTKVFYNIDLLPAYTVRNLHFEVTDTNIRKYLYLDSVNCLIIRGKPYDEDVLAAERNRFEKYIRNMGFYAFSSEFVTFRIDSTVGKRQVDIYYNVRNTTTNDNFNRTTVIPHSVYRIKNVYIYPDYDPGKALELGDAYIQQLDTILYKGYYFVTSNKEQQIRYDLILQTLYVKAGADYNLTNTEQTQSHLMALSEVYRLVNINYTETDIPEDETALMRNLNCNIMLTLRIPQSYKIELEGTNSSGNIGGALNLVYQHKNLFHGAELFSITLRGAYEGIRETRKLKSIQEYGIETSLKLPQFLIPFIKKEGFIKKYNPSTTITTAYNYQSLPLFTRTVATATFGYTWNAGYVIHIVNPLQLNLVKIPPNSIDSAFAERIKRSYQAYSYRNVLILGGGYSYIFNNSKIKGSKDYWFLRVNAEAAGNMLSLVRHLSGSGDGGNLKAFGQPFAQYVRTDFDLRYYYRFNDVSSIVYRGFVGIGVPYGNSRAIPFEKQYFAGGANSIRAWQVRTLGPGSYSPVTGPYKQNSTIFLNQTADIKLEANAEYRFKLFWLIEGALFVDAGNIWNYYKDPRTPGAEFNIKNFYKDIAVGTGTGFRFDFKFVIARVDLGMKLRDPILLDGSKWIFARRPYSIKRYPSDLSLVFGIGYPF